MVGSRRQLTHVELPSGSKYPIFKDSGPKDYQGSETRNIGYLDPLGYMGPVYVASHGAKITCLKS